MTGAGDRETLPRSRHKQEARNERLALSSASLPQVRTSLEREGASGRRPIAAAARDERLYRLRAARHGSRALDLFAHRETHQSVAVPGVPERLAVFGRSREQHGSPSGPVRASSRERRTLPHPGRHCFRRHGAPAVQAHGRCLARSRGHAGLARRRDAAGLATFAARRASLVADADRSRLDSILSESSVNLRDRSTSWQKAGWKSFDPACKPYGAEEVRKERQLYGGSLR